MRYTILDPTGNVTALVEDAVPVSDQPQVATRIMERHTDVEQVGFVSTEAVGEGVDLLLRMAGGEFCGNATMSAAALFLERTQGRPADGTASVKLGVSGADEAIAVRLKRIGARRFEGQVSMPEALAISMRALSFEGIGARVPLVLMQGISHLIIDEDSAFYALKDAPRDAERAVRHFSDEVSSDGLGCMFLERTGEGYRLTPLVYVPGAHTCFWERSCASGTTAAAMYLANQAKGRLSLSFIEPGGMLAADVCPGGKTWLKGSVRLVSEHVC